MWGLAVLEKWRSYCARDQLRSHPTEYKWSRADARSWHIFAARDSSTNHKQGPAFPPMVSMPMLIPGVPAAKAPMQSAVVPLQSAAMPPMAGRCAIAQSEDALP